jgi:cytosine/adenosine deaminase-related metal-dependent hydrolase
MGGEGFMTTPPKSNGANLDRVFAGRLLARPGRGPVQYAVSIGIAGDRIEDVSDGVSSSDHFIGGAGSLVLPALANAHDHGRGLRPIAYGAEDQPLEAWLPATYTHPPVDPYLVAGVAFSRMALGGFGSAVHCHLSRPPDIMISDAEAVARAAADVGLRIAFVVPMRDRHRMAYAKDELVLAALDPADREDVLVNWVRDLAPIDEQIACVEEIAARFNTEMFQVQYGPVGVEFCSDEMLEKIAQAAQSSGRRIHMHLQETKYQRQWADGAFPKGIIHHLDQIGLLTPGLTVAHGVWLRPAECEILAERGVILSVNTSSNLRLRSGIAPVADLVKAGVELAFGLDAASIDDDDDGLREMRLTQLLHAGAGFDEVLSPATMFDAAMVTGPRAVTGRDDFGVIAPGRPADLIITDFDAMAADLIDGLCQEETVFLSRAKAQLIEAVIVAGRCIVKDRNVTGFDLAAASKELKAQAAGHGDKLRALRPLLKRYQQGLKNFYLSGGHIKQP